MGVLLQLSHAADKSHRTAVGYVALYRCMVDSPISHDLRLFTVYYWVSLVNYSHHGLLRVASAIASSLHVKPLATVLRVYCWLGDREGRTAPIPTTTTVDKHIFACLPDCLDCCKQALARFWFLFFMTNTLFRFVCCQSTQEVRNKLFHCFERTTIPGLGHFVPSGSGV